MVQRKIDLELWCGAVRRCVVHDRTSNDKRKPTAGCTACLLCWLSHKLQTSIYLDDAEEILEQISPGRSKSLQRINPVELNKERH